MQTVEFLTPEQIKELTGAGTKARQIEVLRRNGIRHTIKCNGWPCVTTAAIIQDQAAQKEKAGWKPRKAS